MRKTQSRQGEAEKRRIGEMAEEEVISAVIKYRYPQIIFSAQKEQLS